MTTYTGDKLRFKGVTGADDQLEYKIVNLQLPEDEARKFDNSSPMIFAVVGDVEILDNGLTSIRVRKVLRSVKAVEEAKAESESNYAGTCESSFAVDWKAG